jgi:hypothetical protein
VLPHGRISILMVRNRLPAVGSVLRGAWGPVTSPAIALYVTLCYPEIISVALHVGVRVRSHFPYPALTGGILYPFDPPAADILRSVRKRPITTGFTLLREHRRRALRPTQPRVRGVHAIRASPATSTCRPPAVIITMIGAMIAVIGMPMGTGKTAMIIGGAGMITMIRSTMPALNWCRCCWWYCHPASGRLDLRHPGDPGREPTGTYLPSELRISKAGGGFEIKGSRCPWLTLKDN